MKNESLDLIIREIETQQEIELNRFKQNLSEGIDQYVESSPSDLMTPLLKNEIDEEVKLQMLEFQRSIDLSPKALYYALKMEVELDPNIKKDKLKQCAYEFLEKTTKYKYLKKIIRELKKGV